MQNLLRITLILLGVSIVGGLYIWWDRESINTFMAMQLLGYVLVIVGIALFEKKRRFFQNALMSSVSLSILSCLALTHMATGVFLRVFIEGFALPYVIVLVAFYSMTVRFSSMLQQEELKEH